MRAVFFVHARCRVSAILLFSAILPLFATLPAQGQSPRFLWGKVGSPALTEIWRSLIRFDSRGGTVIASSGYAVAPGATDSSGMMVAQVIERLLPDGSRDWLKTFRPGATPLGWITVDALQVDAADNVYTAGTLFHYRANGDANEDFIVRKVDSRGRQIWVRLYDSSPNAGSVDVVAGMALDGQGGAIVSGTSSAMVGGSPRQVITTIRYDPQGRRKWIERHVDPLADLQAWIVEPDRAGGIYIAGTSSGAHGTEPIALRYDRTGKLVWEARSPAVASALPGAGPWPAAAVVGPDGSLAVCVNALDSRNSYTCLKYTADGVQLWRVEVPPGPNRLVACRAGLNADGNLVVGATVFNGRSAFALTAISPEGRARWTVLHDARPNERLLASDLDVDGAGNTYLTGIAFDGQGEARCQTTIKASPSGSVRWKFEYGGGRRRMADLPAIAASPDQRIAVTGQTNWWSFDGFTSTMVKQPAVYLVR